MSVYVRIAAVMFLNFFIWGAWFVTAGLVLSKHGLGSEIGNVYSLGPVASLITPFLFGYLIDRYFSAERVLAVLHLIGAVLLALVPSLIEHHDAFWLLATLFVYNMCFMPTLSLTNNVAFHHLGTAENFPYLRIFANVGWIVPGFFIGSLGLSDSTVIFDIAAVSSAILGFVSLTLPKRRPNATTLAQRGSSFRDGLVLFKHGQFVILLLCMMLITVPLTFYYAYTATFADAVGFKQVGTVMTIGQLSDLVAIALIPLLIKRVGYKWMILAGMIGWIVRYCLYSAGSLPPSLTLVFIGIAIHGICYDFLFVTAFIYTEKIAGAAAKGQAQGLVMFFTYGLGMLIGAQVAGHLYNSYVPAASGGLALASWKSFWLYPLGLACVAAFVHLIGFRGRQKAESTQSLPA
ncbi:MFS transporter [Paraburkholderia agricolaris]|jgi:nucleoside transporter|uniref:MFS transporter n=1 Tax=Paraburkholderia agricolaris TaxID=2152888 RepID=UPI0012918BC2|nr:MFS transporter [Paraburkholderia agricolaris]